MWRAETQTWRMLVADARSLIPSSLALLLLIPSCEEERTPTDNAPIPEASELGLPVPEESGTLAAQEVGDPDVPTQTSPDFDEGELGRLLGEQPVGTSTSMYDLGTGGTGAQNDGPSNQFGVASLGLAGTGSNDRPRYGSGEPLPTPDARSHVVEGDPTVTGALEPAIVRRVVRLHRHELRGCHTRALEPLPTLEADAVLHLVVSPSGEVSSAQLLPSTLPADLRTCTAQRAFRWAFPAPSTGIVRIEQPLAFTLESPD